MRCSKKRQMKRQRSGLSRVGLVLETGVVEGTVGKIVHAVVAGVGRIRRDRMRDLARAVGPAQVLRRTVAVALARRAATEREQRGDEEDEGGEEEGQEGLERRHQRLTL